MNRRAPRRTRALGLTALVVTLAVTGTIGTTAGPALAAAAAASADPVVISPGARFVPRATIVLNAGETGFLTAQEGDDRLRWIDYASGATTVLDHRLPKPLDYDVDRFRFTEYPADFGHGSDTVAVYADSPAPHVTLQQRAGGGATATVPVPDGQSYVATYGDTVITRTGPEGAETSLHLLRLDDGQVRDQELAGLPQGWNLTISEGDARSVAVRGIKWEDSTMSQGWWVVDLATGKVKALSPQGDSVSFDQDTVFQLGAPSSYAAQVYSRADLDAEPTTLDLRDVAYDDVVRRFGDDLVTVSPPNPGNNEYRGNQLVLRDTSGNHLESLLAVASTSVHRTPDGSLLVAGAEENTTDGALDWGYYRFTRAADGTITRKRLADIEDREADPAGISLGSGILTTADDSQNYAPGTLVGGYRSTWLKTSGRPDELRSTVDGPVSGRDADCGSSSGEGPYCVTMFASGDGYHGRKAGTEQDVTMLYKNGEAARGPRVTSGLGSPELVDLSGRFGIVNQGWGGQQAVLRFGVADSGSVLMKREPVAASVWGNTLWSAAGAWDDTSSGVSTQVAARNLATNAAGESFDAGCVPSDLQAVGRWVYWRCSDYWNDFQGAGVYDRQTKASVKLGADETLLGDGYLVHRSAAAGLTLVDLHDGLKTGAKEADLPQRVVVTAAELGERTGRRSGWTVDRFGGHVAYTGGDRRVRIVPSGVPASPVTAIDADTPATVDLKSGAWAPRWWLSKPGASWSLALKHKATGTVVRTLTGGEVRGQVTSSWDGKDTSGKLVNNGAYTWTLTARPADGQGAALTVSGTVNVSGGAAVWRDMVGDDGFGDLLATDPDGTVSLYRGTGTGTLSARTAASGDKFAANTLLVPFGDVDGDRCDDVLARVGNELRAYRPGCGKIVSASSPYTLIGSGWGQYDRLTSSGDVNGDGYADLIARQTTTGDMYFYAGTADHRLKTKVRIGTNWKLYNRIVGAGDLNGDGRGDLLGVDSAGALWRYYGTATGGVTARVKIGPGWAGYTALVGPGDLTGDGRAALLARDASGKLWRYASTGDGKYAARVLVGTAGWNRFTDLF
ncbi:FG-GAP-like repeat-containing protein [Streptomyces sp. NPDC102467]|uniref:FG-GAP-like repeat-containing protein n=1 Tax=Streptomyces sp. NPDC102467 TaxID=3366179 RepID=UPI00380D8589